MSLRGLKITNEYSRQFAEFYEQTPKAVFAAIAFSMCFINVEERGAENAIERFHEEWTALHDNGIVPQKPFRKTYPVMESK